MRHVLLLLSLCVLCVSGTAFAGAPLERATDIAVTVLAHDAKFIGSAMGGAQIVVRDRRTGDIIASGVTAGDTGDTKTIMAESRTRDAVLLNDTAAKFEFTVELFEPTPVTISATAPLAQPQAQTTVSMDTILFPGKDYTSGNGIMIDMPGFAVDVLTPPVNDKQKFDAATPIHVSANVVKLCGCKIESGSPWNPERYTVEAHAYLNGLYVATFPMGYADKAGQYALNLKVPQVGTYKIIVTAFDAKTKEGGMDATTITLE